MSCCIGETKKGLRNFIILYVVCITGLVAKVHTCGYTLRENWIDYILLVYFMVALVLNIRNILKLSRGIDIDGKED